MIGMSDSKVRSAIAYNSLPDSIKEAVEARKITYGIAVQLARLHEDGADEQALHRWATNATVNGHFRNVKAFKDLVDAYLREKNNPNQIALFDTNTMRDLARPHHRETLVQTFLNSFNICRDYLERVEGAFEDGLLGQEDSPFSEGAPTRALLRLTRVAQRILNNHLRSNMSPYQWGAALQALTELSWALQTRIRDLEERKEVSEQLRVAI
jgi:hypothetical protein